MRLRLLPIAIFALVLLLGSKLVDVWTGVADLLIAVVNAQEQPVAEAKPSDAATPTQLAAIPTPKSAPPADFPGDPTLYPQADVDVLQKLAQRRTELESWAGDLSTREQLLKAAEGKLEDRLAELKTVQGSIKGLLRQYDQEQENKLKSLVKVYGAMKPKDAARIFEELDMDVLLDVVERMKEAKVSPILAALNPDKAKTITVELAQRRKMGAQASSLPSSK